LTSELPYYFVHNAEFDLGDFCDGFSERAGIRELVVE
jgi:hypothetical protein